MRPRPIGAARRAQRLVLGVAIVACFGAGLGVGLAGCATPAPETEAQKAERAQALIDYGNAAYRQGDYRLAVRRYSAAAVERKDDPAAYYGMGMALAKLGRDEEARAAYARARELAQSGAGGPPPNHP